MTLHMSNHKNDSIIDNENVRLVDELQKILPRTERASIAVGYFFISGFAQIMNHLDKIEASDDPSHVIRLLISPTTNKATAEALLAGHESFEAVQRKFPSELNRDQATRDIKKNLEYMHQKSEDLSVVKKLIELIHRKKLQIKVYTKTRLHAKAYIFETGDYMVPSISIVGSSNLSISGINDHAELNLKTREPHYGDQLLEWFERHWNDEECYEITKETFEILNNSWAGKMYSPKDVYEKASVYEAGIPPELEELDSVDKLYDFQQVAVIDAIKKLEDYGGVIVADVVGTGKSYIGSVILKYLQEINRSKILIICPPHLQDMWQGYLTKFKMYGKILSRYKIGLDDKILREVDYCDAILIDESHNFRNSNTEAYKNLLEFMEYQTNASKVIMLTATPISNTIHDLKNQLKLFPADMLSHIPVLEGTTLDDYFKGHEDSKTREVTLEGTTKIRELLRHILIRRTRKQITEKYAKSDKRGYYLEMDGAKHYFPTRNLQHPKEYDPDKVYDNSFDDIEEDISNLTLARYAPGNYLLEEYKNQDPYEKLASTTTPLIGIVRTTLLKRMESSIKAFHSSVNNYKKGSKEFREQLKVGKVPIGEGFQEAIYEKITSDDDDGYDEAKFEKSLANIKSKYDIKAFDIKRWIKDITKDIRIFSSIQGYIPDESKFTKVDEKLHILRDIIKVKPDEKVLIFSESAVTAKYIYEYLRKEFPKRANNIGYVDSSLTSIEKNSMVKRFDPVNNESLKPYIVNNELNLLVSTDVLSEGINLQSGRTIINYDFHWNPVRLIQRVGRLDRIGSKHAIIDIFNFLPASKIDLTLSLRDRVANKIQTMRKIIGQNQKVLEATESLDNDAVKDIYSCDNAVLDSPSGKKIGQKVAGLLDIEEMPLEQAAYDIKNNPERMKQVKDMPFGIRSASGRGKLLIGCEARITTMKDDNIMKDMPFRRYYEITEDEGIKSIWKSQFFKQMDNNHINNIDLKDTKAYDEQVAISVKKFYREMRNAKQANPLKHQKYIIKECTRIASDNDLDLARRARSLHSFLADFMIDRYQPYESLRDLHKQIDEGEFNDQDIIERIEKIKNKHKHRYTKEINRPRILYSMMISK